METTTEIRFILDKINRSEDEWKALFMASWSYAGFIKEKYIDEGVYVASITSGTSCVLRVAPNEGLEAGVLRLGLPSSRKGFHEYRPAELHSILVSRDGQLTIGHLQTIFLLFEEFISMVAKNIFEDKRDVGYFDKMKSFLSKEFPNIIPVDGGVMKELDLAKKVRNCFIHKGGKIDLKMIEAYRCARGSGIEDKDGKNIDEAFPNIFHEVENWHRLIVDLSNKIGEEIQTRTWAL